MSMNHTTPRLKLIQALIIAAYVWSLALPALISDFHNPDAIDVLYGYMVLMYGSFGLLILDPRWIANIFFFICSYGTFSGKGHRISPIIGTLLVIGSICLPIHVGYQDRVVEIESRGFGVYVWAVSLISAFITSILLPKVPAAIA